MCMRIQVKEYSSYVTNMNIILIDKSQSKIFIASLNFWLKLNFSPTRPYPINPPRQIILFMEGGWGFLLDDSMIKELLLPKFSISAPNSPPNLSSTARLCTTTASILTSLTEMLN